MKFDNQLRYASDIVRKYDGKIPLSAWLKDFFRVNKQMGSNDRRTVSEIVYSFYRLGHNPSETIEQRLLYAILHSDNLPLLKDYFSQKGSGSEYAFDVDKIFPFKEHLSEGIDFGVFSNSFLRQPGLFLRIRPSRKGRVIEKLREQNIPYHECGDDCIALANGTKVEQVVALDEEAVVQDKSSQQTGDFLRDVKDRLPPDPLVWDCCAASGGKSIMAFDLLGKMKLTVSDKRESIVHNLQKRFSNAGIHQYTSFVADLTNPGTIIPHGRYDLIIADVPCSGSGTWARTPEQLYFFREEAIAYYSGLQKKIISRVTPALRPKGLLLYITCSVFAEENEINARFFGEKLGLDLIKSSLLTGYHEKADTLYAALFTSRPV